MHREWLVCGINCKYDIGWQIVAVILCDTGVALLAYMDGITGSPTLSGVVLAASAAAGSAVYKVSCAVSMLCPHGQTVLV